jgi:hypothetical protein
MERGISIPLNSRLTTEKGIAVTSPHKEVVHCNSRLNIESSIAVSSAHKEADMPRISRIGKWHEVRAKIVASYPENSHPSPETG